MEAVQARTAHLVQVVEVAMDAHATVPQEVEEEEGEEEGEEDHHHSSHIVFLPQGGDPNNRGPLDCLQPSPFTHTPTLIPPRFCSVALSLRHPRIVETSQDWSGEKRTRYETFAAS